MRVPKTDPLSALARSANMFSLSPRPIRIVEQLTILITNLNENQVVGRTSIHTSTSSLPPRIGLFITCLADFFRPTTSLSTAKLLSSAGCRVEIPKGQTCCGQPAYNNGDIVNARALAQRLITQFEGFDYIVAPSGSCVGMLKKHYPTLFTHDPVWGPQARRFAERCFEITGFLVDVCGVEKLDITHSEDAAAYGVVTYHDSCSGLRELGIHHQPRILLARLKGLEMREMVHPNMCCGFGGTFCVKYPEISTRMVSNKVANIRKTDANTLVGGDLGCLFNIAGRLERMNDPIKVYHVAEVLAGMSHIPAIAENMLALRAKADRGVDPSTRTDSPKFSFFRYIKKNT
uniref:L-lactate dehydrogenase complex protein LldE n=1 Tax=Candidatus Kentrum sp. TUN TaxID=2126343 RepID=A0A450ZKX2_9GAMM|nr:MAG: L-lactate dehydrogenase complex protein LldE [Candidatus Kentron sp. TUN]VFK54453.1 MAG: L-lactate dehydrogenase complex protein LldE [Candidatus Kentron sp. TUN]VFK54838.1 MAG: L-lactate dehydrogenase complex protein LldE [Candidatus Kentron sp. TUN]